MGHSNMRRALCSLYCLSRSSHWSYSSKRAFRKLPPERSYTAWSTDSSGKFGIIWRTIRTKIENRGFARYRIGTNQIGRWRVRMRRSDKQSNRDWSRKRNCSNPSTKKVMFSRKVTSSGICRCWLLKSRHRTFSPLSSYRFKRLNRSVVFPDPCGPTIWQVGFCCAFSSNASILSPGSENWNGITPDTQNFVEKGLIIASVAKWSVWRFLLACLYWRNNRKTVLKGYCPKNFIFYKSRKRIMAIPASQILR